jgi:clan AA aspartic protease (TIGR02281 family)
LCTFWTRIKYINKAIEADSTNIDLYEIRAGYNAEMGNRAAAFVDLDKYVEAYPQYYMGYHRRAWYKHLDGQYEAAIEDYTLSITLKDDDLSAYASRGRCYLEMGKEELAKADFEKVLALDSVEERSAQTAFAYHHLGQDSLAIEWIQHILEEDSTEYYNAACVYALVNDVDNALAYLRLAFENGFVGLHHVSVDPDFASIRHLPEFQAVMAECTALVQSKWQSKPQDAVKGEVRVVEVPFSPAGGVTTVKCAINGLPLTFIFDTGASSVSLSKVEADFMYKNGYLTDKDIVGKQYFQTADGNISVGTVINLKEIVFGGLTLTNVRASVTQSQSAPLLLGQSVLQRLGKIEIDNEKRVLKITTTENVTPVAEEIVEKAVEDVISNATDEIEELVTEEETEVVETLAAEDIVVEVIEEPTTAVVATEEDEEPVVVVEPTVEEVIESTVEETVPEVVEEGVEIVE